MPAPSPYRFRFFRAGAVDQVDLADADALANLRSLDQKLWMALACPTQGLEIDRRSLELIDSDHDGRIRPPEILAAVDWAKDVFVDLKGFFEGEGVLPLATLRKDTDAGRALLESARRILTNLGRPKDDVIRLEDVLSTERVFEQTTLNGDGIVPLDAASDEPTRKAVGDILAVMGSVRDRSGKPGIDRAKADAFFEQIVAYAAWLGKADAPAPVRVLGDETAKAFEALSAVRAKVDDYFMRARLSGFDPKLGVTEATPESLQTLAGVDLTANDARVARWPLAHVAAGRPLALLDGVNPAWSSRLATFVAAALAPLLGDKRATLTEATWEDVKARLAPYEAWQADKPALAVAALGDARIRELAAGDAAQRVRALIEEDAALEAECNRIESVEKAIRLRRDLVRLLRSFVTFADFYGKRSAVFQVGTLYIDGRSCDLCLPVADVAKHAALAGLAKAFLVYCDCKRKKDAETRAIVAVVTAGGVDNLMTGRNGVFYDTHGDDWDATVTRIVENPIDVRSAFWSPYKRFVRAIEQQVVKRAAAADTSAGQALEEHAVHATTAEPEATPGTPLKPAAAPAPAPKGVDVGTVAAVGVAVGGIATFFSSVLATFLGLGMWMPFGLCALLLAISGPSMLIAWLKLSQRNIGPVLDANGWAVNAFARINVPFGTALTKVAELPSGARRILDDPFAERRPPYATYATSAVLLALCVGWAAGALDGFLPERARAQTILHRTPVSASVATAPSGHP